MSEQLHPDPDALSAFVEGVLPEHERAHCLAHLAECSRCREIVFLAQDKPVAPVVVPVTIRPRLRRPMPLLAAAAAVCFAVLGTWLYERPKTAGPLSEKGARSAPAPEVEKPAEVEQPTFIATETAPRVSPRRRSERAHVSPSSREPASQEPSPAPVTPPAVAPVAPSPPVRADSAEVAVQAQAAAPASASQIQITPVETLSGISGTVTDASGAVIPQAPVELRQIAGNSTANARTDQAGNFTFTGLAPGRYELRITRAGFRSVSQQVELHAQEVAAVKFELQIGSTTSTVEVTAAASNLQTASASLSRSPGKRAAPPPPRPLPSKLPAETTVTRGKITLAVDSSGALFYSGNSGKSWKAVKRQWPGKIGDLLTPPNVPEPGSAQFQLTTDSGADWLSRDGRRWYPAPPQH
jgi:hypothetical protein